MGSLDKAYDDFKSANEIEPNNKEIGREMIRLRKVMIREPDAIGKETKVEESMHLQMGDDQRSQVNEKVWVQGGEECVTVCCS